MNEFHNVDLNLVRIFDALMAERSVTGAGKRLGLTQSAISHALKNMRHLLDDQLFVRSATGMHPTPRAETLAGAFRSALGQIESAFKSQLFEPATSNASFVIAASDYTSGTLLPLLLQQLQVEAPNIRITVRPLSEVNLVEELDRGSLHVAIGSFSNVPSRFRQERLTSVSSVWAMRAGHPAAHEPLTLEVLAQYPHIDLMLSGHTAGSAGEMIVQNGLQRVHVTSNPQLIEGLLAEKGLTRRVGATVSHFLAVPRMLAITNMVAFLPRTLASEKGGGNELIGKPPPYAAPTPELSSLSHRTMGSYPNIAWLRQAIHRAAILTESSTI